MTAPVRVDELTPAEREDFEERAAIIEYEAKVPREEAERRALICVLRDRR